jgi:hypothetical protein
MARLILCAALALSILPGHVRGADLGLREKTLVLVYLYTISVSHVCAYKIVVGGVKRSGDQDGVETDKLLDAADQAMRLYRGEPYDRFKVIPEVTRVFEAEVNTMTTAIKEDKAKFCQMFAPKLLQLGTIEK